MASMKDIKRRRDSIQSTGQITKAMNHIIPVATQYQTDLINNVYKMQSLFQIGRAHV